MIDDLPVSVTRDPNVATVRAFNRLVTERIGALQDDYLARRRPLGAARLLWEIGGGTDDVRALRTLLGLDSGYLSRLLRSLEREGLIEVTPAPHDGRVRTAHLTADGRREWDALDRDSDELARSLLDPLDDRQRGRLVEAMTEVRTLLTAGLVEIGAEDPASADAQACIANYFAELEARFDGGFDPARTNSSDVVELVGGDGVLLVARLRGDPVGCGALKLDGAAPAEIKRLWVSPAARGLGLGRRLLAELERAAVDRGADLVRLDTNRALTEAIALYHSTGYREIPAFNDEAFAHHWFEKAL